MVNHNTISPDSSASGNYGETFLDTNSEASKEIKFAPTKTPRSDARPKPGNEHEPSPLKQTGNRITKHKQKFANRPAASAMPVIISTQSDDTEEDESTWEGASRGMPSWMTSMIVHLTLILILALMSVGNGGSAAVELLASSTEDARLEDLESLEIALETPQLEPLDDASSFQDVELDDDSNLNDLLQQAATPSDFKTELEGNLFESISTTGFDGSLEQSDVSEPSSKLASSVESGATFFGIEGAGNDFIYIVDCSGSMSEPVNQYARRWDLAREELENSISDLRPDQRFLILLYNRGFVAMNSQVELVNNTAQTRKEALEWLARGVPNSFTFAAEALATALSLRPDSIFLLSDGEFDDRAQVFAVLEQLNGKSNLDQNNQKRVQVNTVALGSHIGRFTMERIANENDGVFQVID